MPFHTLTWLAWLGAAAYLALLNQQPLQSVLCIVSTGLLFTVASRRGRESVSVGAASMRASGWLAFLRLGLWVWAVALVFNLLSSHAGDIVLFRLPPYLPLIGGPITLEALLYGVASGASLFAVLLVFATFNLVVDRHLLLRWVPAGLFEAGLVVSIALAFVPQMLASLSDIRDAQRLRGYRFRGLRDLLPLFLPLITTALERSLTLAESMEARGFAGITRHDTVKLFRRAGMLRSTTRPREPVPTVAEDAGGDARPMPALSEGWVRVGTLVGLTAVLVGSSWRALRLSPPEAALPLVLAGIALLLLALRLRGRQSARTTYRHEAWRPRDSCVTLACAASVLITTYYQFARPQALAYYPYPPRSPWPEFSAPLGIAILLLAAPAFLWPAHRVRTIGASHDESQPSVGS